MIRQEQKGQPGRNRITRKEEQDYDIYKEERHGIIYFRGIAGRCMITRKKRLD